MQVFIYPGDKYSNQMRHPVFDHHIHNSVQHIIIMIFIRDVRHERARPQRCAAEKSILVKNFIFY